MSKNDVILQLKNTLFLNKNNRHLSLPRVIIFVLVEGLASEVMAAE